MSSPPEVLWRPTEENVESKTKWPLKFFEHFTKPPKIQTRKFHCTELRICIPHSKN